MLIIGSNYMSLAYAGWVLVCSNKNEININLQCKIDIVVLHKYYRIDCKNTLDWLISVEISLFTVLFPVD